MVNLNTVTRQECKGKIYVKNIRKNLCRIRQRIRIRNQLKSRIWIREKHSGSTTLSENDLSTRRRPPVSIMCARAAGEGRRRCAQPAAGARQGTQILYNHWLKIHCCLVFFIKINVCYRTGFRWEHCYIRTAIGISLDTSTAAYFYRASENRPRGILSNNLFYLKNLVKCFKQHLACYFNFYLICQNCF